MALTRLPEPHNPPQDQAQLLAAVLQSIVALVGLGSIVIRTSCHCDSPDNIQEAHTISYHTLGSKVSLPIDTAQWSGWRRAPATYSTLEAGNAQVLPMAGTRLLSPPLVVSWVSSRRFGWNSALIHPITRRKSSERCGIRGVQS